MNCDTIWELLSVYADGEASVTESRLVEDHVAQCADCARDLSFMQATAVSLQETPEVEPPAYLREAILAATVDRPSLADRIAAAIGSALRPAPVRYGAMAAAGAALVFTLAHQGPAPTVVAMNTPATPDVHGMTAAAGATASAIARPNAAALPKPAPRPLMVARVTGVETHTTLRVRTRPTSSVPSVLPTDAPRSVAAGISSRVQPTQDRDTDGDLTPATEMHPAETDATASGATTVARATVTPSHEGEASAPAAPAARVVVAAGEMPVNSEAATLADLKRSLRANASVWSSREFQQNSKDREIRVSVIRGTF